ERRTPRRRPSDSAAATSAQLRSTARAWPAPDAAVTRAPRGEGSSRSPPSEGAERLHEPVPEPDDQPHAAERDGGSQDLEEHGDTSLATAWRTRANRSVSGRVRPPRADTTRFYLRVNRILTVESIGVVP